MSHFRVIKSISAFSVCVKKTRKRHFSFAIHHFPSIAKFAASFLQTNMRDIKCIIHRLGCNENPASCTALSCSSDAKILARNKPRNSPLKMQTDSLNMPRIILHLRGSYHLRGAKSFICRAQNPSFAARKIFHFRCIETHLSFHLLWHQLRGFSGYLPGCVSHRECS